MATPINIPVNAQLQNVTQLQRQIQQATQNLRINLISGNSARSLTALSQPLGRLTGQADEFSKSLDAANARVLAFGASVGVVNTLSNAFKALVSSTIEVEKAITAISVVGDQFAGKNKQLSQGLFAVAKATGQSFAEVSKAALEFSRQGLNLEQTLQRTQDALVLTRLTGLDAAKSVDGLTASVNAFSKAGLSTTQILNKLAAVDQAFAVSSADLIEGFNRSAAVAQNAGVTFDELAGIITALQQETSRGGAVIGNALKTIFTRLQDTSTLNQLQNLGVAVQDLEGNLLPARQILQNLAKDVEGLGQITRAGIFKDVAGTFQINQLISLVSDLGKANSVTAKATQVSAGATNEAFIANEKLNQSLDAILNKVANTGKQLGALLGEIGLGDNLKGILDGINSFLEGASNLLQGDDLGSRFAQGIVKGIGSVLTGPGIGLFLAVIAKLSFDLAKFGIQSAKTFFGIGQAARDQQQVQEAIVQTLIRNQSVLSQILNTQGGQNAQAQAFLNILKQEEQVLQNIRTIAGGIAAPIIAQGYRPGPQGLQRRSAGGYLPAQEAADVRRGVGGASSNSQVVAIPNFAFGGGKRGTMIANTSEYIVPNYAGGGSAIFNQDMVKTMGLPPGAKKISASGGFIPNFLDPEKSVLNKSNNFAMIVNDVRGRQSHRVSPEKDKSVVYEFDSYGVPSNTQLKNKKGGQFAGSRFTNESLIARYATAAIKESQAYAQAVGGRTLGPYEIEKLSNPGVVRGLVGAIFESGIGGVINGAGLKKAQADQKSNALIDFNNQPQINEFFGIDENIEFIEAKYTASSDALKSMANKIYNVENSTYSPSLRQKKAGGPTLKIRSEKDYFKALSTTSVRSGNFNFKPSSTISSEMIKDLIARGGIMTNAADGYIPNFAASALMDAISREKSAGLSASQIYVDQSPALKSSSNPMGLMVANRRDEPAGGFQGIARARKEGMNPKTYGAAKGFVPNFFSAQLPNVSQYNAPTTTNAPTGGGSNAGGGVPPEVAKGFADTAGKIFLLQSALSFLTGAVGDTQNSFAKLAVEAGGAAGNISSLLLFGNEIRNIKVEATGFKGALGNFAKGLGIAGVAFGVVSEGLKFANFAIKEFSGENKRAALESAKLADATNKAALRLDELSKNRQTELAQNASKILGEAGFESFFGGLISDVFGSERQAGGSFATETIKQGAAQILALGGSEQDIKDIIARSQKTETITNVNRIGAVSTQTRNITQVSDIEAGFAQAFEKGGIGEKLNESVRKFQTGISGLNVNSKDFEQQAQQLGAASFGQENFNKLTQRQQDLVNDLIAKRKELTQQQEEEQKTQNAINFGERLNLELAKQRLDSVFQLKQISEESLTPAERFLQFQLETLDLSNREKILKEAQLKNLDLERKKRIDILSATKSVVDQASQGGLSVNTEDLDKLTTFLQDNLGKSTEELSQRLQDTFKLSKDQADNLLKSLDQQTKNIEASTEAQKGLNAEATNLKLRVDDINSSLQNQLDIFQRIAQTAQLISNFDISSKNLQIGANEAEISRLEALAADPTLTQGQQDAYRKQVIDLQKRNNELKKGNELSQFQQKQADILLKQREKENELVRLRESNGDPRKIEALENEIANLNIQLNTELNNYNAATAAINANNKVLDIQASQIGKVAGAYASLQKQLEAFRLGAGERVASAQLEALGATDIDSLAKAGIRTDIEAQAQGQNLNNADYYKFIQEGTRLREIQYDIAVAESETRRRELEYELKYTQELIDLKARGASEAELQAARIRQIEEQRGGRRGFEKGIDAIQDRINNYKTTLGEEIPNLFSQNLAQGLNDAISGAKSLKEALRDAATSFFQAITQRNIQNLADVVTGGIGGFFTKPKTAASGGLISGGSGIKDDIPAMLMGGEYVIKKSAVKKYGSGFFDALNKGGVKGFANGGGVQSGAGGFYVPGDYGEGSIRGKGNLLAFAGQSFTSGQYDRFGSTSLGGASVSLEAESARLTAFGRENSPLFERVQQSKEEAFKVYLDQLNQEKQYRNQLKQMEEAEKQRQKQLVTSIVSAVVTSVASAGLKAFGAGFSNAAASSGKEGLSKFGAGIMGGFGKGGASGEGGLGNLFSGNFKAAFNNIPKSDIIPAGRASGGMIYGGSGTRDDVPAMLTGGEFVLNNRATRKLGVQNLNRLNAGETGGGEDRSGAVTESLLSKLDELIQATRESSSENVVVNVSSSEAQGPTENGGGTEKELQRKIRQAVLDVIAQEKRLGGSLNKDNR
jgi:TP901 family phage tail tape measure protein